MPLCAHLWLSGRVQGVAFRYYAAVKAKELGVSGYIRNLDDGRVEILVQGEPKAVDDMIKWCRKGPPYAIVKDVVLIYEEPDPKLATFQVKG
ncbi:MAG TPA: acylphosphatase [Acetomicrobium flavidum]|uniref:acylphosphatase n=1 Tax=Acetomicrobium flavidum TaxID=49896 RepID=A0ABY1JD26_9BACT|nr:acylphosphatase [Acetomicrobium flavidum]SIN67394.1 acylphosphatase [Acetomicrobium flavidum]HOJ82337.1 acylphosphatase [Acetomicrobium flavidum]HOM31331.1 acylphosphatase [Acetomicrobium flavidum]HOP87538.1 acylphosphatase [Acetomicrobium flavidum]